MTDSARLVSTVTYGDYVFEHKDTSVLAGICVDLWKEIALDLNLTYTFELVDSWWEMHPHFKANKSDVIMERMDDAQMDLFNITK